MKPGDKLPRIAKSPPGPDSKLGTRKPTSFHAIYQLAITFNNHYWEQNCKQDHLWNTEKEAADSYHQKQGKIAQYSVSLQSSALSHPQLFTNLPQTAPS